MFKLGLLTDIISRVQFVNYLLQGFTTLTRCTTSINQLASSTYYIALKCFSILPIDVNRWARTKDFFEELSIDLWVILRNGGEMFEARFCRDVGDMRETSIEYSVVVILKRKLLTVHGSHFHQTRCLFHEGALPSTPSWCCYWRHCQA